MLARFHLCGLLTVAASLVLVWGCGRAPAPAADDRSASDSLTQVACVHPARKTLQLSTTQPGRIQAFEETPLHAKVAGFVEEVLVDIGDVVKKDQLLIRLSIPELSDERAHKEALVEQAEAEVRQAEASVTTARAAVDTAQAKIVETEAGIARAEADHRRWQSEYERIKELAAQGSVTKKLEEETQSQLASAEAATREIQAQAQSARSASYEATAAVGKAEADQAAAAARLRVAQAELAKAQTMLSYTEIKAPYDGTVTQRNVDTGHFLQPARDASSRPLMVVARTDTVRIFVDVPELEASLLEAGDPAVVQVQALHAAKFTAQVVRSGWALSETNHSLLAEIDIPNPDGRLRPGMYAVATIRLAERPDALVIPVSALLRGGAGVSCVVVADGKATIRPLQLGLRSGGDVEVLDGLNEDEQVVERQPELFQDGQPVRVAPAAGT